MSSNPSKKKSKGSTSLVSHKLTAINVSDIADDELNLLANRNIVSAANRGRPGRNTKRSVSIIENSSEDEEDKSSSSNPEEDSDNESDKDDQVVDSVPSLITPPRTGEKRKRGSKNSE